MAVQRTMCSGGGGVCRGAAGDFGPRQKISYWAPKSDQINYAPNYFGLLSPLPPRLLVTVWADPEHSSAALEKDPRLNCSGHDSELLPVSSRTGDMLSRVISQPGGKCCRCHEFREKIRLCSGIQTDAVCWEVASYPSHWPSRLNIQSNEISMITCSVSADNGIRCRPSCQHWALHRYRFQEAIIYTKELPENKPNEQSQIQLLCKS